MPRTRNVLQAVAILTLATLAAQAAAQLKRFLRARVYESAQLVEDRRRSVARIEALFDLLYRRPELLPTPYREESAGQPLHRQVCDYIAGMTDGFFMRTCGQCGIG